MDPERIKRLKTCGVVTAAFGALWLVCLLMRDTYLFGWALQNGWGVLVVGWGLALLLGAVGLRPAAYFVALGNVVGVFFGQYFGDFLVSRKVARLPADPSSAERYLANYHHGAFIWVIVALVFLLAGLVWNLRQRHKQRSTSTK